MVKKGVQHFKDFLDDGNVPSDVAMAIYIHEHYDAYVTVIDGTYIDYIDKKLLNKQDVIFVIYDAIEVFHCGERKTCPYESLKFEKMMNTVTSFVYPPPDFHKYIINKPDYYADLERAGVPIVPFIKVFPDDVIDNPKKFKDRIINKGWKGIIIKPSYAGYSLGIRVFKNVSRIKLETLKKHFIKLRNKGFPNAVVQEFVKSFGDNYEIRTYWINQKYAFSVATLTKAVGTGGGLPIEGFDTFKSEGGNIPDHILNLLKPVAEKAMNSILQYKEKHPMLRIDFGCCLGIRDCVESYFINEIETMAANMLADYTKYPVVEKVAQAAYEFSKKVKGKRNSPGKKAIITKKYSKIPCKI